MLTFNSIISQQQLKDGPVSDSCDSERQGVEQAISYYSDNLDFKAYSEKPSIDAIYNFSFIK